MKVVERWHSDRIGEEVAVARWGTVGVPVLIFPTAGGDFEEIERFHLVGALEGLVEAGPDQGVFGRLDQWPNVHDLVRFTSDRLDDDGLRRGDPTRGGSGDPGRLPDRRHRNRDRRGIDRRLQRPRGPVPASRHLPGRPLRVRAPSI